VLAKKKLKSIPAQVWLIGPKLKSLDVSNNQIKELTSQIGALPKLQNLVLSHNQLEELPEELYHLNELKVLLADHNKLKIVAAFLPRTKLRTLDLSYNEFSGIVGHPYLALPPCCTVANLSYNKIQGFADSFGWELLTALEELDLDNNQILALPPQIGCLTKLSCLKLRNNNLTTLPPTLFTDTSVNRIHLEGNPVKLSLLRTLPGFDKFLDRRKERISKGISQGLHTDHSVCGLTE